MVMAMVRVTVWLQVKVRFRVRLNIGTTLHHPRVFSDNTRNAIPTKCYSKTKKPDHVTVWENPSPTPCCLSPGRRRPAPLPSPSPESAGSVPRPRVPPWQLDRRLCISTPRHQVALGNRVNSPRVQQVLTVRKVNLFPERFVTTRLLCVPATTCYIWSRLGGRSRKRLVTASSSLADFWSGRRQTDTFRGAYCDRPARRFRYCRRNVISDRARSARNNPIGGVAVAVAAAVAARGSEATTPGTE